MRRPAYSGGKSGRRTLWAARIGWRAILACPALAPSLPAVCNSSQLAQLATSEYARRCAACGPGPAGCAPDRDPAAGPATAGRAPGPLAAGAGGWHLGGRPHSTETQRSRRLGAPHSASSACWDAQARTQRSPPVVPVPPPLAAGRQFPPAAASLASARCPPLPPVPSPPPPPHTGADLGLVRRRAAAVWRPLAVAGAGPVPAHLPAG